MSSDRFMDEFTRERDAALRSMDEERIRAYARRYGAEGLPKHALPFWASVHRARLSLDSLTEEEHAISREWLRANGFRLRPL